MSISNLKFLKIHTEGLKILPIIETTPVQTMHQTIKSVGQCYMFSLETLPFSFTVKPSGTELAYFLFPSDLFKHKFQKGGGTGHTIGQGHS